MHKDERLFRKGAGNNRCLSVSLNYVTRVCLQKEVKQNVCWALLASLSSNTDISLTF